MSAPTQMTSKYGPIVEMVRGAQGHIRRNVNGYTAVAFVGIDEVHLKSVEGPIEGREWVRAQEAKA